MSKVTITTTIELRDSTKRLIRNALSDLKHGFDITIVAYPHDISVSIARTICRLARERSVTCSNLPECKGMGPRVKVREYNASIPFPTPKSKVHIDCSAVFERGMIRPSCFRTVLV